MKTHQVCHPKSQIHLFYNTQAMTLIKNLTYYRTEEQDFQIGDSLKVSEHSNLYTQTSINKKAREELLPLASPHGYHRTQTFRFLS